MGLSVIGLSTPIENLGNVLLQESMRFGALSHRYANLALRKMNVSRARKSKQYLNTSLSRAQFAPSSIEAGRCEAAAAERRVGVFGRAVASKMWCRVVHLVQGDREQHQ